MLEEKFLDRILGKFDKLDDQLNKMDSRLDRVDVTLGKQHVSLDEHIRRTELLEKQVEPIKRHVIMVGGALKFIGVLGIMAALTESVIKLIKG